MSEKNVDLKAKKAEIKENIHNNKEQIKENIHTNKEQIKEDIQSNREQRREDFQTGKDEIKKAWNETIDPNGDKKISAGEIFGEMFNIHKDVASKEQIKTTFTEGGRVSGTNMCLLVLAIFVASIGLNVGSTAVIIGAMLISPLMGTIHALAYGTATSNIRLSSRAIIGLLMQIIISLTTSTIYFLISPLSDTTSELLARTQPTIWDVLIAIFGGIAGVIGVTRKEKTNVIPGVAIATALMPPLCTCGYSIAHGQWHMLLGAGYLFLANTYFIFLSALVVLFILKIPEQQNSDPKRIKRLRNTLIRNTIIIIIPSIVMAYFMVSDARKDETIVTGFEVSVDVPELKSEVQTLFPDITDVLTGHIEKADESNQLISVKEIILESETDYSLDENKEIAEKITKWLSERYDDYSIRFEKIQHLNENDT